MMLEAGRLKDPILKLNWNLSKEKAKLMSLPKFVRKVRMNGWTIIPKTYAKTSLNHQVLKEGPVSWGFDTWWLIHS